MTRALATAIMIALLACLPAGGCGDGGDGDDDGNGDGETAPDVPPEADAPDVPDIPGDQQDTGDIEAEAPPDAPDTVDVPPDDATGTQLAGWWVWAQEVENGEVILTINHEDMIVKVGPSGWDGCPDGIICTHYGIYKFAFDASGFVHFIHNVNTSSDFQYEGTTTVDGELVAYSFNEHFSCAHPDINDTEVRTGFFIARIVDGNLWVSVSGFGGDPQFFSEPPVDPQRWVVYRPITQEEFETTYMIRLCQAPTDDGCHPDCFPESYGTMG
jgi:hypothetical protein